MKFRTELEITPADKKLDPRKPLTLLGSCFTEHMGKKMQECMWDVYVNPCGVIYNPYTAGEVLLNSLLPEDQQAELVRSSILERDGMYVSWHFDSSIHGTTAEDCVEAGVNALQMLGKALMESQGCIVTWGTAHVYRLKSAGFKIVNNCHKRPASEFEKSRLTVEDIIKWNEIIANSLDHRLWHLRTILTVSPVRYLSDGFGENALSKATLRLACEGVDKLYEQIEYFPAYELVNDDLRDYRFYNEDMVHPNQQAVNYVWDKFKEKYFDAEGKAYLKEGATLYKRLHHRPIIADSEADRKFREETEAMIRQRK